VIIINDIHLGVNRVSGTTPQSREDLRSYVFSRFSELLRAADGHDLCILGDLFDGFEIPARDWLDAYFLLSEWCENNPDSRLYLVAGNHDVSLKGNKVSAFTTLSQVLRGRFDNVVVTNIDGTYTIGNPGKYAFIVAHHGNQELFDLTLDRVLTACQPGDHVLLHANYHNPFAERADHSLNVSEDQALEFTKRGVTLVFAHEHQHRHEIPHGTPADGGSVVCLGNQIPTSVADCLGNESKYFWELKDGDLQKHVCWNYRGDLGYQAVDWRHLEEAGSAKFIRIVGDAVNAQAADVMDAIHKFRQKSAAFVITNAVKIEGIAEIESLPETFEAATKFDVMQFVYEQLDEEETKVIRKIAEALE
jgi:hypothetical protein